MIELNSTETKFEEDDEFRKQELRKIIMKIKLLRARKKHLDAESVKISNKIEFLIHYHKYVENTYNV